MYKTFLHFFFLFIGAGYQLFSGQIYAQSSTKEELVYSKQSISITPIEVIRKIDVLLASSRLEALEAGRGDAFSSKVNVAKSFVHAGDNLAAEKAYSEALSIAWKRQFNNEILSGIKGALALSNKSLITDTRPGGLDENYQPIKAENKGSANQLYPMDKYEAGKKIDQALAFIYLSILKEQDHKLTLQGKLNHCRHLIELEEYELAKAEYHQTIIQYLDPRWTSQLLEEIDGLIANITPNPTSSEMNPSAAISSEHAIREINEIIKPIQDYYAGNAVLNSGVKSMHSLIRKGEHEQAIDELKTTFIEFAPRTWVDKNSLRASNILGRVENLGETTLSTNERALNEAPIIYSKSSSEGRVIETIRIIENSELMTYKRVSHNWGGVYNFINDESTKDTEWMRVWNLYQKQEF